AFANGGVSTVQTSTFIVADLDGKPPLDFVVVPRGPNDTSLALLINKSLPGQPVNIATTVANLAMGRDGIGLPTIGRLDGDAYPDLLVPHVRSAFSDVDVLWGNPTVGSFTLPAQAVAAGNEPNSVAIADFNHDQCSDFAVAADESRSLHVYLQGCSPTGIGSRTFTPSAFFFGLPHYGPLGLIQADVNSDGPADLLMLDRHRGELIVMLGQGDGRFAIPLLFPVGAEPAYIATGDLDGDGRLDLAIANRFSPFITLLYQRP
ncbi:VCBS repeat-containing protein, partial [Haliangium sp. UPWRP_2]|uniref:FG-GAP repeat domain-containing protein n=1 Tax=Haliangium sp. UPWRP_2 TaxID=1931276 RepID=UPI0011B227E9